MSLLVFFPMKDFLPLFGSENYFNTLQQSINNDENLKGQGEGEVQHIPSFNFYK